MRKIFFGIAVLAAAQISCAAAEAAPEKKLLFLSDTPEAMEQNAIINGAREALSDLNTRYGADVCVLNITPASAAANARINQPQILEKYLSDPSAIGAIVVADPADASLAGMLKEFEKNKKPVALIRNDLPESGRSFFVETNGEKAVKSVLEEVEPHLKKNNFKLLVVHAAAEENFAAAAPERATPAQKALLESLKGKDYVRHASSEFFSKFSKKFEGEIEALDNYGVILLDAAPLINSAPIKPDSDRNFIIIMSLRPYLGQYLRAKTISMCIGDDYFGFGYLSAIAVLQKHFEGKNANPGARVLDPIKYKVFQSEEFDKNLNSIFK